MRSTSHSAFRRQTRQDTRITVTAPTSPPPLDPTIPPPDGDGIRWDLVARMKQLIASGELDTPERWAIAEELLFADASTRG